MGAQGQAKRLSREEGTRVFGGDARNAHEAVRAACALVSWRASEDETAAGIAAGIAEGDDDDSVAARRLALAVEDACAVAAHLRRNAISARSGGGAPRVAFVGFGFGAAVGWAAAAAARRRRGRRRRVRVGRARPDAGGGGHAP